MNNFSLNDIQAAEETFKQAILKAIDNKHTERFFIGSLAELFDLNRYIKSCKLMLKLFTDIYKNASKSYINQIILDKQDLQLLLTIKQFKQCLDYYKKELSIVRDIRDEYKAYVFSGHICDTILSIPRAEEDMIDFRVSKFRLF